MATTHAPPASSRASLTSTSYPSATIAGRNSFPDNSPRNSPRSQLRRMDDSKRKHESEEASVEQARYPSHSPTRSLASQREEISHTPNSRGARRNSGNELASPRTQLPSFNNLTSSVAAEEEESSLAKRRRVEGESARSNTRESARSYSSPQQEYEDEDDRLYRREMSSRQASRRDRKSHGVYSPKRDMEHFEGSSMGAPPTLPYSQQSSSLERNQPALLAEENYESNLPLARRRGDAAQAKASRLHIDTGSNEPSSGGGIGSNMDSSSELPRSKTLSSITMHGFAKSAPPHKMTFSDREGPAFDPRGDPPPQSRGYTNGPLPSSQPYYPSVYTRKDGIATESHSFNDASPAQTKRLDNGSQHHTLQQQHHSSHRQAHPSAGTPLTALRPNAFVPQTATLPSPAYHTTHFMRNHMVASSSNNPGISHDPRTSVAAGGGGSMTGPPRTAGLNPPPTARLPEHLRSPPSSKTQFLSLFSNFYDSLTDSRTLKATLEDQVRRSNTLLQTLQKSSRVLELTVDRRIREERNLWEAKVQTLEERCLRLERQLGTAAASDEVVAAAAAPATQSISPAGSNPSSHKSPSHQATSRVSKTPSQEAVRETEEPDAAEVRMDE